MTTVTARQLAVVAGKSEILSDGNLTARAGRVVGLIGPNGAGKTTLLRAILGLAPLARGAVTVDGVDMSAAPAHRRARTLAYLPQGGVIHWPITVERLVLLGRLPHLEPWASPGEEDRRAVEAALAAADVSSLCVRLATTLSGGERTRVLLARALATEAPVLLADEPVAALDPYHQLTIMALFRRLAAAGRAVVVVLHDLGLAARYCDDLVLIAKGKTAACGTPTEVLTPQVLTEVYGVRPLSDLARMGLELAPPPMN